MKPTLLAALAVNIAVLAGSVASAAVTANFVPLAGQEAILDHTNGTGTNARFFNPTGVAVDTSGNVYVADTGDHTIRIITSGAVSTVLAGVSGTVGNVDGALGTALLGYPFAVTVDANQNVYFTDVLTNSVRKITHTTGAVATIATGFSNPEGIAVDGSGNVYVSDTNNSVIKKISASGGVSVYAGSLGTAGFANGALLASTFNFPAGLATDATGNVYVADYDNNAIRMITVGTGQVSTLAGTGTAGSANGAAGSATFNHPQGVSVDGSGNVYVVDTSNQLIREISGGSVTTVAGMLGVLGATNSTDLASTFAYPYGVAATSAGVLYVADTGNHSIREVAGAYVSTYAGSVGVAGFANAADASATFHYPYGVAVSSSGTVYVADSFNNAIRQISGGNVTTLAGTGLAGSTNGAAASATFNDPEGVAVDTSGNVYVADTANNAIRKIAGGIVSTFATGFSGPQGIAVDSHGNVYVADTNNDTIDMITPAGAVTVIAGSTGNAGSANGTGTAARFNKPNALAVDSAGNIFVSDFDNLTIRKIAATTYVTTTLAGTVGQAGYTDGSAALFNQTYGVAVDSADNVYVTDTFNRVVRQITSSGYVTTVTGTQARFFYPEGIAIDSSGNLYVTDADNNSISEGAVVSASATGLANHTVAVGGTATFTLLSPDPNATFVWQVSTNGGINWTTITNGAISSGGTYSGATTSTLVISGATSALNSYEYRAVSTDGATVTNSPAGTLYVGTTRLLNLSSSGYVSSTSGSDLIAGFVIGGSGTKAVLLRGIGPSLTQFGVTGALSNPILTLYNNSAAVIATNTVWGGTTQLTNVMSQVGAFTLASNSLDSALYQAAMSPGSYTTHVDGAGTTTGVALAEVYDADTGTPTTRLANISSRAPVGTANLVAGFVIGGTVPDTVLIRGVGPGLTTFGIPNALSNVQLTVYDSHSNVIASNNGWTTSGNNSQFYSTTFTNVGAFPLTVGSLDSAVILTLAPGSYTASVSGVGGATGNGMVEIYEVP